VSEDVEVTAPALPGMEAALDAYTEAQLHSREVRLLFELQSVTESAPWMDDYFELVEEGWPWRQAVYMLWASQPADRRRPPTQMRLAIEVLGLRSDRTIREWRTRNPSIDVRVQQLQTSILAKHRAEVLQALATMAADPDYKAHQDRKLFLEMTGDYVPKSARLNLDLVLDEKDLVRADEASLRAMAESVIDVDPTVE
jgi:hypothetical protein